MKFAVGFSSLFLASAAHAASFTDVNLGVTYNDNLSYGSYSSDVLSDTSVQMSVLRGFPRPMGDFGTLTPLLSVEATAYADYDDLNNVLLNGGLFYKSKWGVGQQAPWYRLGGQLGYRYSADDLRDIWRLSLSATLGKRYSDRVSAEIGYSFQQDEADSAVFDGQLHGLKLAGDYLATDDLLVFGSVALYSGDIVATAIPNVYVSDQAIDSVRDPAYGAGRYAYRLEADTMVYQLGANYYLSEQGALEFSYKRRDSNVGYCTSYLSNIYSLNYIYSF